MSPALSHNSKQAIEVSVKDSERLFILLPCIQIVQRKLEIPILWYWRPSWNGTECPISVNYNFQVLLCPNQTYH